MLINYSLLTWTFYKEEGLLSFNYFMLILVRNITITSIVSSNLKEICCLFM